MLPLDVTHPARAMEPLDIALLTNLGQLFPHLILRSTDKHTTFSRFPPTDLGVWSLQHQGNSTLGSSKSEIL